MKSLFNSMFMTVALLFIWPLIAGLVCGLLSAWIAGRKHRRRVRWFLIGFLFPVIGLIVALFVPSRHEPAIKRIRRLRRNIDTDIKRSDERFRRRAAGIAMRAREMEEASNRIHRRLVDLNAQLKTNPPDSRTMKNGWSMAKLDMLQDKLKRSISQRNQGAREEGLYTERVLRKKGEMLNTQLANTAAVVEKLSYRIKRLTLGADGEEAPENDLQEIIEELSIEVEALEDLHQDT